MIRQADIMGMNFAIPVEGMTRRQVRAEMDRLAERRAARCGVLHPAEYWRWRELAEAWSSLAGADSPDSVKLPA